MKNLQRTVLTALLGLVLAPSAFADRAAEQKAEAASIASVPGASIRILAPADGAHVDAGEEYPLNYEVSPGKGGDHFHVWVDGKRGPGIHDTAGKYTLPKLAAGEHVIAIRIVDKDHVATGPEKSIRVIADADDKK